MSAFWETVDRTKPMGAARIVRRERFAWPGGYPLALVMNDGGMLCPDCVQSEFHLISDSVRLGMKRSGWYPLGYEALEDTSEIYACDHCGRDI